MNNLGHTECDVCGGVGWVQAATVVPVETFTGPDPVPVLEMLPDWSQPVCMPCLCCGVPPK